MCGPRPHPISVLQPVHYLHSVCVCVCAHTMAQSRDKMGHTRLLLLGSRLLLCVLMSLGFKGQHLPSLGAHLMTVQVVCSNESQSETMNLL